MWRLAIVFAALGLAVLTGVALAEPTEQITLSATGGNGTVTLPAVTTTAVTLITTSTATLNGNITSTGGETCDIRGFVWDSTSRADPGNATAPAASAYLFDWTASGNFATGVYGRGVTSLSSGTTYYVRAVVHNNQGYSYGNEVTFDTIGAVPSLPVPPTDLTITETGVDSILITWTTGAGSTHTLVRISTSSYPTSVDDGEELYFGPGGNTTDTGLSLETTTYYVSAWGYNAQGYSTSYATARVGGDGMIAIAIAIILVGLIYVGNRERSMAIQVAAVLGCFIMVPYWSSVDGRFAAPMIVVSVALALKMLNDIIRGKASI